MCLEVIMKKKNLFNLVCVVVTSVLSVSCSQNFYQVYTMDSNDLKMQDNSLLFENADCQVSYNFWSDGGHVSFAFKNKTDKDIFINMNESFLVVNGNAHNYFEAKTYTYGSAYATTIGYGESLGVSLSGNTGIWANKQYTASAGVAASVQSRSAIMNTVSRKEQEIVCIPANSFKTFSKFCLSPVIYQKCVKKVDFPSNRASLAKFDSTNSPIIMNNRLTYGFKIDAMDKHIDNVFWLGEIENFSEKSAIEKSDEKGCYDLVNKEIRHFKIGKPSQFYRHYQKRM